MGFLDHFRGRKVKDLPPVETKPVLARPPTGFLSWVMLTGPGETNVPAILRRLAPADAIALASWPEPTYFDWLGLIERKASGRATKATVNYEKPLRLQVMETLPMPNEPSRIIGAIALCDQPKERPDALELAYLERAPGCEIQGFGTAALAICLMGAREKGLGFFLDALLKSNSHMFYMRCGMVEVDGTPWPTQTVRMQFPSLERTNLFLDKVREKQIIP